MQGQSPIVNKGTAKTMSFPEIIQKILVGKKVTRLEWESNNEYGFMKDETLCVHTKGKDHTWVVSKGDMMGNDWFVIPSVN